MRVLDIIEDVTLSELMMQNRYDSGDVRELTVTDVNRLVSQINRGLTELHRRFQLKVAKHTIGLSKDRQVYDLPESTIELLKAWDSCNDVVSINRQDCDEGIRQLSVNSIEVSLNYLRNHKYIVLELVKNANKIEPIQESISELEGVELDLPEVYKEALIMFVASRMTASLMNGAFAQFPEGQNYFQRFENICGQLQHEGLEVEQYGNTELFYEKGFV